tara:strand:+ start:3064 stop:3372 length:309 start_codon:yes stop_codon:yes gene_type:complete
MDELDKIIETETDNINTLGITDPISEEYLKEICERYYQSKVKNLRLYKLPFTDWTYITEHDPPKHELVLVYCENGQYEINRFISNSFPKDATHWRPLPEPPK